MYPDELTSDDLREAALRAAEEPTLKHQAPELGVFAACVTRIRCALHRARLASALRKAGTIQAFLSDLPSARQRAIADVQRRYQHDLAQINANGNYEEAHARAELNRLFAFVRDESAAQF